MRELAGELGYEGGKSIFDDYVREVQTAVPGAADLPANDLSAGGAGPVRSVGTVGAHPGRSRPASPWLGRDCEVCWSRAIAGTLIFSKEAPDILWGLARNLQRLGVLPEKLVWDRESAIAAGGRPTESFAAFCGQLEVGWVILEARDPQAKGALERSHRFMRSNFEPGRVFANHLDFQDRLDAWTDKANSSGASHDPRGPG